jgi:hypothetical protein
LKTKWFLQECRFGRNLPTKLADDAVHRGQTEPGALPTGLVVKNGSKT